MDPSLQSSQRPCPPLSGTQGGQQRARAKITGISSVFFFFTISSVSVFLHLCMTAARRDLQLSLVDFLATSPFVSYGIRGRLFARATFRVRCNIDLHSVMNVMLAAGPELMAFSSTCSPAAAYSASQLVESCLVCSATPAESLSLSFMHTRLIFETDGPKTAAPPFFFFYPKFHSPIVITALFLPQFGIVFSSRNNQLENDDGQERERKKRKQVLLLYIWRNHAAARPPTFLHERVSVCFGRQRRRLLLLKRKCTWMMIFSLSSVDGAGQLYGNQLTGVRNDVGGWGDISSDRPLKRKEKESSSRRHMAASS